MNARWILCTLLLTFQIAEAQHQKKVRSRDRRKNVELSTNYGIIELRLADETPLHRDNFIRLVKSHYFDGILFHRVIDSFMIQSGDPQSKGAAKGKPLGEGGPDYTIPAEIVPALYHKKGALGAARESDDHNPEKASSGSQFYIVQGKTFTEEKLAAVEEKRLKGIRLPEAHRESYKTLGGAPHLDGGYTVFGEVVKGWEVVKTISAVPTSKGKDKDRPIHDVVIKKARLVRRKN